MIWTLLKQSEVLNLILGSYVDDHKFIFAGKQRPAKITFDMVMQGVGINQYAPGHFDGWLIEDGYLELIETTDDGDVLALTKDGREFWNSGKRYPKN